MFDGHFAGVSARLQQCNGIWVEAHRHGDTAVGMAIETHLGIKENNLSQPDYLGVELKTRRETSRAQTTLLTMNPTMALGSTELTVHRMMDFYGVTNVAHNQIRFNTNLAAGRHTQFRDTLTVGATNDAVQILRCPDMSVVCEWNLKELSLRLLRKLTHLAMGTARTRTINAYEQCNMLRWDCFSGFRLTRFEDMIRCGDISINFRVKADLQAGKVVNRRNRGTAFRVPPTKLRDLYSDFLTLSLV